MHGLLLGVLLVFVAHAFINKTIVADWMVSPLLLVDNISRADIIVVPGAGVTENCVPNQNAVRRVILAVRLWRDNLAPVILFTGGTGPSGCPVAGAMASLAGEMGVPASAVLVEAASASTHENARDSAPLLHSRGATRILLVTDRLHMKRAAASYAHFGFDVGRASVPIYEGHVDNVSMVAAGAREFVALTYYRLRGWLAPAPRPGRHGLVSETARLNAPTAANPQGPLVVLGASYAASWKLQSIAGVAVLNKGIAGQQTHEMLERFEGDVTAQRPRAVLLWGFINDISRSGPDIEATLRRTRDNYAQMVAKARAAGIEAIVATEVTMRPPDRWSETIMSLVGGLLGKQSFQDRVNGHVIQINRWLAAEAARQELLVLDFHSILSDPGGRRRKPYAQEDGSHITPAGYEALTGYASPVLERHFGRQGGTGTGIQ